MTCYIDKRNYDIEMSYDMLYRQEKLWYRDVVWHAISTRETIVSIEQLALNHFPCYNQIACNLFLLGGLRVQFQDVLTALSLAINLVRLRWRLRWWWWGVRRRQCKLGPVSWSVAYRVETWHGLPTLFLYPLHLLSELALRGIWIRPSGHVRLCDLLCNGCCTL
jgi:hypothetical protein